MTTREWVISPTASKSSHDRPRTRRGCRTGYEHTLCEVGPQCGTLIVLVAFMLTFGAVFGLALLFKLLGVKNIPPFTGR